MGLTAEERNLISCLFAADYIERLWKDAIENRVWSSAEIVLSLAKSYMEKLKLREVSFVDKALKKLMEVKGLPDWYDRWVEELGKEGLGVESIGYFITEFLRLKALTMLDPPVSKEELKKMFKENIEEAERKVEKLLKEKKISEAFRVLNVKSQFVRAYMALLLNHFKIPLIILVVTLGSYVILRWLRKS